MREDQYDWFQEQVRSAEQAIQGGRPGDAAEIAEAMFQRACDTLDEDGIGMGAAMQQVASVSMRLGDPESAQRFYREACDLYRENVGARHLLHITCLRQLAAAEASVGSAAQVVDLLQEKERLTNLVLGPPRED